MYFNVGEFELIVPIKIETYWNVNIKLVTTI